MGFSLHLYPLCHLNLSPLAHLNFFPSIYSYTQVLIIERKKERERKREKRKREERGDEKLTVLKIGLICLWDYVKGQRKLERKREGTSQQSHCW
jgi:hypothetical protein